MYIRDIFIPKNDNYLKFPFNHMPYVSSGNCSQGVPVNVLRAEPAVTREKRAKPGCKLKTAAPRSSPAPPPPPRPQSAEGNLDGSCPSEEMRSAVSGLWGLHMRA